MEVFAPEPGRTMETITILYQCHHFCDPGVANSSQMTQPFESGFTGLRFRVTTISQGVAKWPKCVFRLLLISKHDVRV